jgi:hypothetical protein
VVTISSSEAFARKVLESVEREASRMLAADLRSADIEFF